MGRLENKVAIVTGAAAGIGGAIAKLFGSEGAKVLAADVDEEAGKLTVKEITQAGGAAKFLKVDVLRPPEVEAMVGTAENEFGGLDIIVNNAISVPTAPEFLLKIEMEPEHFQAATMGVLLPVFLGTKYAIPAFRRRGGGAIVNTAALAGLAADLGPAPYDVAKGAVISLTRWTAINYAKENIRANAICPGPTRTRSGQVPMLIPEIGDEMRAAAPSGRIAEPIEQAWAALFLASDEASNVTGVALPVDGGMMAFIGIRFDWTTLDYSKLG